MLIVYAIDYIDRACSDEPSYVILNGHTKPRPTVNPYPEAPFRGQTRIHTEVPGGHYRTEEQSTLEMAPQGNVVIFGKNEAGDIITRVYHHKPCEGNIEWHQIKKFIAEEIGIMIATIDHPCCHAYQFKQ